jgi:hypothetical protein
VVTQSFPKYLQNTGFTENILGVAKITTITNVSYSAQIPRTRPLTLGDMVNFRPMTEPNPESCMGGFQARRRPREV